MFALTLLTSMSLSPLAPPATETPEAVIQAMSARITKDATDYEALMARGKAYRAKKDYMRSTEDFIKAAGLKSNSVDPLRERAITAIRNGKFADAQSDLQQAMKIEPKLQELTKKYNEKSARVSISDKINQAIRMSLSAKATIYYAQVSQDIPPRELAVAKGELQGAVNIMDRLIDQFIEKYPDDVFGLELLVEKRIVIARTD